MLPYVSTVAQLTKRGLTLTGLTTMGHNEKLHAAEGFLKKTNGGIFEKTNGGIFEKTNGGSNNEEIRNLL